MTFGLLIHEGRKILKLYDIVFFQYLIYKINGVQIIAINVDMGQSQIKTTNRIINQHDLVYGK